MVERVTGGGVLPSPNLFPAGAYVEPYNPLEKEAEAILDAAQQTEIVAEDGIVYIFNFLDGYRVLRFRLKNSDLVDRVNPGWSMFGGQMLHPHRGGVDYHREENKQVLMAVLAVIYSGYPLWKLRCGYCVVNATIAPPMFEPLPV